MLDAPWSRHGSEGVSGRRRGPEAGVALNEVRLCARHGLTWLIRALPTNGSFHDSPMGCTTTAIAKLGVVATPDFSTTAEAPAAKPNWPALKRSRAALLSQKSGSLKPAPHLHAHCPLRQVAVADMLAPLVHHSRP